MAWIFDPFKSREFTWWFLFITYPPNIYGAIINIPLVGVHHNTLANYPNAFVILILGLQPCHILFHHIPEVHQKSEHFWTFLLPSPSSNPFELNSNEFEFKSFNHAPFYFSWNEHIFVSPGKLSPCANLPPNLSFFSFFSLFCFIIH